MTLVQKAPPKQRIGYDSLAKMFNPGQTNGQKIVAKLEMVEGKGVSD